jgi:hypothetical protein
MKKYYFIILLLLSACITEVPFPERQTTPKLVVGCLFGADSLFNVYISKTQAVFDTSDNYVSNTKVELWQNGIKIEELQHIEKGLYRSSVRASVGIVYTIKVSAPDYVPVEASDIIPEKQHILEAELAVNAGFSYTYLSDYNTVNIIFTNDIQKKLYYETLLVFSSWLPIFYFNFNDYSEDSVYYNSIVSVMSSDEPFIQQENYKFDGVTKVKSLVFSNNLIHEVEKGMLIKFYGGYDIGSQARLNVYLKSISENYYLYKKTLRKHLESQGFVDPTSLEDYALLSFGGISENVYTNVKNGYGIFAGYSVDTVSFNVESSDF